MEIPAIYSSYDIIYKELASTVQSFLLQTMYIIRPIQRTLSPSILRSGALKRLSQRDRPLRVVHGQIYRYSGISAGRGDKIHLFLSNRLAGTGDGENKVKYAPRTIT